MKDKKKVMDMLRDPSDAMIDAGVAAYQARIDSSPEDETQFRAFRAAQEQSFLAMLDAFDKEQ